MTSFALTNIPVSALLISSALVHPLSELGDTVSNSSSFEQTLSSSPPFVPRKTLQIVWSCAAAIISCTWVAIHPNMEICGHLGWMQRLLRRIYLVILTILTPELMSAWAYMQFRAATATYKEIDELRKQYGKNVPWTKTHSHFLLMGGFRLACSKEEKMSYSDILIFHYELEDGSWEGVLTPTAFKDLIVAGKLKYPTITKEEIDDRSKGDGISKSLALLQLFWFILQIAIRSHYGLASTFIEWITMALCLICSMMYTFWMSKPFNAHCPVVLRILGPDEGLTDEREGTTSFGDQATAAGKGCLPHFFPSPTPLFSASHYFIPTIWDAIEGAVNEMDYQPVENSLLSSRDTEPAATIFYVPPTDGKDVDRFLLYPITIYIGCINGSSVGLWFHPFPSRIEHILWRVASCCTMLPFYAGLYHKRIPKIKDMDSSKLFLFKMSLVWIHYFGRITMFVICFTTLRNLPDSTLKTIDWVDLVPHI